MPPEIHPSLRGKSIVFVEVYAFLENVYIHCVSHEKMRVAQFDIVPRDILEIIRNNSIDAAIIHPSNPIEKDWILKLAEEGVPLVIVKRDPPLTNTDIEMYERFEKEGIRSVKKTEGCYFKALDQLSDIFTQNTEPS